MNLNTEFQESLFQTPSKGGSIKQLPHMLFCNQATANSKTFPTVSQSDSSPLSSSHNLSKTQASSALENNLLVLWIQRSLCLSSASTCFQKLIKSEFVSCNFHSSQLLWLSIWSFLSLVIYTCNICCNTILAHISIHRSSNKNVRFDNIQLRAMLLHK